MLIDSHCHLDFEAFDGDRELVLDNARSAGVVGIINPAIDLHTSKTIVEMTIMNQAIRAAVGVHPNSAMTWNPDSQAELETLAKSEQVLAIGEIGLDYYRDRAPRQVQQQVFQSQLDSAKKLEKPVIIHCRNHSGENRFAFEDLLEILSAWQKDLVTSGSPLADRPGVLHSYSDTLHSAWQAIDLGFFIGITGPVTFSNAKMLQAIVSELPLDRLLIETDAPFLTPHPYRGKRNEPAYVRLVADKIAMINNLDAETVAQATTANAERLFNWRVLR